MSFLDWGVSLILWLQQLSPALDLPFKIISAVGDEELNLLVVSFVYWRLDRRLGARAGLLYLFSAYTSGLAKLVADQPRPFEYDGRVRQLVDALSGGFPSFHAQNTLVLWGFLAMQARRRWLSILAATLITLVGLSRLYLGVHFPTDVLGGYVIGAIVLLAFLRLAPRAEAWLASAGLAWQLALAMAAPLTMLALVPVDDEIAVTAASMLLGVGLGLAIERRWVRFEAGGPWFRGLIGYILGVAIVLALRFGLKAAFAGLEPEPVFRFLRYAIMGLWFAAGAPWLCVRLGLFRRTPALPAPP